MKSNSEARFPPFSLYTIRPFLRFYSRWDLGIIKQKLMNYPTTEHEAMGQRQRTEDHGKVIFASVFLIFAVIHPTCKHALRKESTIKRSVDDLKLFDDQRRKSTRNI